MYIRLVLTLRRIHFLATQCIYVFLGILKITATISIYIIRLLVFLAETQCLLRGMKGGLYVYVDSY